MGHKHPRKHHGSDHGDEERGRLREPRERGDAYGDAEHGRYRGRFENAERSFGGGPGRTYDDAPGGQRPAASHERPEAPRAGRGFAGVGPRGYRRSDERILEDVCDLLTRDDDVDASGMTVRVEDGEVVLEGQVPDRFTKHAAERAVEHVSGVHDVHNRLQVQRQAGDRRPASHSESDDA
jgi:hypothetical protein